MSKTYEIQGHERNGWKVALIDESYLYPMNEYYSDEAEFRK